MAALHQLRAVLRDHPLVADALLALGLMPVVLLVPNPDHASAPAMSGTAAVVAVLTCAVLALRRRRPGVVLASAIGGSVIVIALAGAPSMIVLTALVALYTVAERNNRRNAVTAWGLTVLAVTVATGLSMDAWPPDPNVFQYLPWLTVAAAVGTSVRTRRAYVLAVEERAERAERSREEEARRRVAEERLRIARELHDVVAHRIAVVNVQAAVASHLMSTEPAAARAAVGHVREAGRAVLDELNDILNVLRQPEERVNPTAPAPGLGQLDTLIGSFASAGLAITWSVTGRPRALAATADLVAYRVLQEALTNAHKHGTGVARVTLSYTSSSVSLLVTNPAPAQGQANGIPSVASPDGRSVDGRIPFGLIGMRERVAAVGGVISAGLGPDGHYRLQVSLADQEGRPL